MEISARDYWFVGRSVLITEGKKAWDGVKPDLWAGHGEVFCVHQTKFRGD